MATLTESFWNRIVYFFGILLRLSDLTAGRRVIPGFGFRGKAKHQFRRAMAFRGLQVLLPGQGFSFVREALA